MRKAGQKVFASVYHNKSEQEPRLAVPVPLWLSKKEVFKVVVTLLASEQVPHLLMG